MTLVLLDTNCYLRLAKRIRPAIGFKFGQKEYELKIPKEVETEVHRSGRLKSQFPWFDRDEFANERQKHHIKLTKSQRAEIEIAASVIHGTVLDDAEKFTTGTSPPGKDDCRILAMAQVLDGIVVTDDLGMHTLAKEFEIPIWHGHELLKKLHTAKVINSNLIKEIFDAVENNGDLPKSWAVAKGTTLKKVFERG